MRDMAERLEAALGDRFRIERHLATGGMASVFLAEDLRHGRSVALKVILPELGRALGPDRFRREVRVTAGLSHPNIRPLLDSGEADGLLYYVQPFIEGRTLEERIEAEGRLGVDDALRLGHELADALHYAHEHGVVHRDVKSANIFLEGDHALLGDFGLALVLESADLERLTSDEVIVGTAEYMSPEQCSGQHKVDRRSDVYSLGCVLFEMLTGEPPFVGRSRMAVISRQLTEVPPRVSGLRPDVAPEVDELVARCLAKTPGDRFASAAEVRDAIEASVSGAGGLLCRPATTPVRRTWKTWAAVAVAAAIVALIAGPLRSRFLPSPALALDPEKVVVFPLADRGGEAQEGADVAMMIGNALVHSEPLRWIDGWELLTPDQREDVSRLGPREARAIALARQAAFFLTGGVASTGDTLSVRLVLHDTEGDSILDQTAIGAAVGEATPDQLGVQAVVRLLPGLLDPGRPVDLGLITDRSPPAIASWIQGDREFRSGRFADALTHYRSAVEADSFLVFAALKGARAAVWDKRAELAADLRDHALRHRELLPTRYQAYALGLDAFAEGRADPAVEHLREALEEDPDWAEVWAGLGEVYHHLLPSDVVVGRSAADAFGEALRLDPDFVPAMVHLAEEAMRLREVEGARELLGRIRALRSDSLAGLDWLAVMEACTLSSGSDGRCLDRPDVPTASLLQAASGFAVAGRQMERAEVGFRHVLEREGLSRAHRWLAVLGLQGILVAEGRDEELADLLEQVLGDGEGSVRFLYALDVLAGAPLEEQARAVDAEAAAAWGPSYASVGPMTSWLLTLWNAREGDLDALEALTTRLRTLEQERSDSLTAVIARAAEAHAILARGDTLAAAEALGSLRPVSDYNTLWTGIVEPLPAERLVRAELLLATGRPEEAYRVASVFDHPQPLMFLPFLPRSLEIRAQAAEALQGPEWSRRAEEARTRLVALGREDLLARRTGGGRP